MDQFNSLVKVPTSNTSTVYLRVLKSEIESHPDSQDTKSNFLGHAKTMWVIYHLPSTTEVAVSFKRNVYINNLVQFENRIFDANLRRVIAAPSTPVESVTELRE